MVARGSPEGVRATDAERRRRAARTRPPMDRVAPDRARSAPRRRDLLQPRNARCTRDRPVAGGLCGAVLHRSAPPALGATSPASGEDKRTKTLLQRPLRRFAPPPWRAGQNLKPLLQPPLRPFGPPPPPAWR